MHLSWLGSLILHSLPSVWPDWAIFLISGNHSKLVATIILPKWPTLLGNFCKGFKNFHFSCEIIFGQLLKTFGDFHLVTLIGSIETDQHWFIEWGREWRLLRPSIYHLANIWASHGLFLIYFRSFYTIQYYNKMWKIIYLVSGAGVQTHNVLIIIWLP